MLNDNSCRYDNATLSRKLKAKQELAKFFQEVVDEKTKADIESANPLVVDLQDEFKTFQEKLAMHEYPTPKEVNS